MPESPCSDCGQLCLHTDDDGEPLCDACQEYRVKRDLILDIALERQTVPKGFSFQEEK
jgi:hypothetical protein